MRPIVIVGAGLAGYTLARELRKRDGELPLTIVAADSASFYSKPMLSNGIAGGKTAAQMATQTAAEMAAQLRARLLPMTRVSAIERSNKRLVSTGGAIDYDRLVLAVGAAPLRLSCQGDGAAEVLSVNNLDDYARFRQRLAGAGRVLIIGAGLIGCEFADDLRRGGHTVYVVDIASQALGRLAPPSVASLLQSRMAANGIEWWLGTSIAAIDGDANGLQVATQDGRRLTADLIVSAVGLQAETALARSAGLAVGRGIIVDDTLATSDPDIFALGDCAELGGVVRPFVLPIMHGARALAATLTAVRTPVSYPPMPVVVKTPSCPVVVCPPDPTSNGSWTELRKDDAIRALHCDEQGRLTGFALAGAAVAERQKLAAGIGHPLT